MTIVKIHGCSGAGKTTAARALLEHASEVEKITEVNNKGKVIGYRLTLPELNHKVTLLGSYENTCGGVDTIGTAQEVMDMIDKWAPLGHVVHEGLLQSTYYGAMGTHSEKYDDYIYAFLDTPVGVCLNRIVERRAESGRNNKFNPKLTEDKHATIRRLEQRLLREGRHPVATIHYKEPMLPQLIHLLETQ